MSAGRRILRATVQVGRLFDLGRRRMPAWTNMARSAGHPDPFSVWSFGNIILYRQQTRPMALGVNNFSDSTTAADNRKLFTCMAYMISMKEWCHVHE